MELVWKSVIYFGGFALRRNEEECNTFIENLQKLVDESQLQLCSARSITDGTRTVTVRGGWAMGERLVPFHHEKELENTLESAFSILGRDERRECVLTVDGVRINAVYEWQSRHTRDKHSGALGRLVLDVHPDELPTSLLEALDERFKVYKMLNGNVWVH